ncbi:FBX34 protein, partial [Polypterus senegalus]|nr:F-box only protein 34 [Polypterus senegalus]XP_039597324.1 F-box only protein 34 [Polypterus senegalus]XP_039597325.1 F-box only protein 34 [Polypterus senegalus]MBN3291470.1 FBX34 protein [Polypterus senegalus]
MHLKPYPVFQKKELLLEASQDNLRGIHTSQHRVLRSDRFPSTYFTHPHCSAGCVSGSGASCRCPFAVISTNSMCKSSLGTKSSGDGTSIRGKKSKVTFVNSSAKSLLVLASENEDFVSVPQEEEADGSLDIWAVIKPGNTKEKIAIFAAHQCNSSADMSKSGSVTSCSNRTISMKIKGCWDVEGSVAKRRKRSPEENKPQENNQVKDSKISVVHRLPCRNARDPSFCLGTNGEGSLVVEGEEAMKSMSVVEMVAYLEQRARALLSDCNKHCSVRSSCIGQTKEQCGAPLQDPADGSSEESSGECVRVLEMVAKLESKCLNRRCERESGGLSRNNSLRRNVGRVLLAGSPCPAFTVHQQVSELESSKSHKESSLDCCSVSDPVKKAEVAVHCEMGGTENPNMLFRKKECSLVISRTVHENLDSRLEKGREEATQIGDPPEKEDLPLDKIVGSETHVGYREEPLPGMLFFKPTSQLVGPGQLSESLENIKSPLDNNIPLLNLVTDGSKLNILSEADPEEEKNWGTVPVREPFPLRRLVSHEFLEMRFKIQQLLEPQQYMAFLPHHIMVKIFCFLPTKTLAALKCTCHYFKFIIENYNVRPADSRWVCDPRYKDDPCKQCKKRYGRGDVSLCRWHPKPYCQALPYGPGYWMCCHGSQKDAPGCNVGLHDNRWVPAFHSFNMPIYKKVKEVEEEVSS